MQYETIILELLSRIKVLEEEVAAIKKQIHNNDLNKESLKTAADIPKESPPTALQRGGRNTRMTDAMVEGCYRLGKEAVNCPAANLWGYADQMARETGMNANSAFIYIYVVRCMLTGQVFKRAISAAALRKYLETIWSEFGPEGLARALQAVRQHMEYRRELGQMVGSISDICDEWEKRLK